MGVTVISYCPLRLCPDERIREWNAGSVSLPRGRFGRVQSGAGAGALKKLRFTFRDSDFSSLKRLFFFSINLFIHVTSRTRPIPSILPGPPLQIPPPIADSPSPQPKPSHWYRPTLGHPASVGPSAYSTIDVQAGSPARGRDQSGGCYVLSLWSTGAILCSLCAALLHYGHTDLVPLRDSFLPTRFHFTATNSIQDAGHKFPWRKPSSYEKAPGPSSLSLFIVSPCPLPPPWNPLLFANLIPSDLNQFHSFECFRETSTQISNVVVLVATNRI